MRLFPMRIGPYFLSSPVVLAPMAGVSDRPFRQLCRRLGAGLAVSEMVSAQRRLWDSRKTRLRRDHAGEPEPRSVQIVGNDPQAMAEAARAIISNAPSLLINRLGLLTAAPGSSAFALKSDSLFASATAGGLYRTDYGAAVRMYRNSFFSDSASSGSGPCLALYDESKQSFAAGLNARDLGLGESAQCVALDRIGSVWYASFKNETGGKVDFTYLEFPSFPLRNPETGTYDLSGVRRISSDAYQRSVAPFGWKNAPDQLKELLIQIPDTTGLSIRVYSRSAKSTQVYVRASEAQAVEGTAFVSDDKTAALFADGTFYYKADNSSAKIGVLKLPQLATGYVYTWFVLTEKTLLAAWEEQRFFETGRTGLFETLLPGTPSVLPASR